MKLNIKKSKYGFSANYGADKTDGTKVYGYVQVGFRKDNEPKITENQNARIFIKDGFLSGFVSKGTELKPKLVVLDYEVIEIKDNQVKEVSKVNLKPINDETVPF